MFLQLLDALLELSFHLLHHLAVRHVRLVFAVVLCLLQLLDILLEPRLAFVEVSFGLVTLLLQEGELPFPKRFVLVVVVDLILQLALHLDALTSLEFKFLRNRDLVTLKRRLQLIDCFASPVQFRFVVLDKLGLLGLQVLELQ